MECFESDNSWQNIWLTGKDWKHGNTEDGGTGKFGAVFIVNDNGSIQVSQILLNFFCLLSPLHE